MVGTRFVTTVGTARALSVGPAMRARRRSSCGRASRLRGRVQVTTDGDRPYLEGVEAAFGKDIDFAPLVKLYGAEAAARRATAPRVHRLQNANVTGDPRSKHISTSYVERQNLTMRISMGQFTRPGNGFSKKLENQAAAVAPATWT